MTTNLIQNHIAKVAQQPASTTYEPKNPAIKPLKGKGKLISGNILSAPSLMVKDTIYDIKALKHAVKGEANDHELGRLNNFGLKLGSLGIAAYLFTRRQTPKTKGMEFIGLGSFLASMAIWPKLAIQLPAYLIHGVNVQKQYEDSFGRRKPFYQDPQFIPWDLYSDEEINKIGNRLKVPENIPNRRAFIQEKMRKLAIQNNTLWMLTAGFAAPVMSALICNQAEPYLEKYLNNIKNKQADKILSDVESYSTKYQKNQVQNSLNKLLEEHAGKTIDEELLTKITETLTKNTDPITAKSVNTDIKELLLSGKFSIQENVPSEIVKNLLAKCNGEGFDDSLLKAVIPTPDELNETFKQKQYFETNLSQTDISNINNNILRDINNKFKTAFPNPTEEIKDDFEYLRSLISGKKDNPILTPLKQQKSDILDNTAQTKLKQIASIFDNFNARVLTLDKYAVLKVGSAPETVIANYWNNTAQDVLKALNITPEKIEKARFNRSLVTKILRDEIENIASDKETYERVMKTLIEKISTIDKLIDSKDINSHILKNEEHLDYDEKLNARTAYEKAVDKVFDSYSSKFNEAGLKRTAKALTGNGGIEEKGTAKLLQKTFASDRLLGVKSSFYRLINTLDYYRRVATNINDDPIIKGQAAREIKEELVELCKLTTLEGRSSDFATKFYLLRNPNPNELDKSDIVVEKGKVKNLYYGVKEGTDLPCDKYFYQNAMQLMFESDMHPDTQKLLENSSIKNEMHHYRNVILEKLGGEKYFAKPRHLIRAENFTGSDIKFLLTGISPDELIFKTGNQMFNTKKWLKTYSRVGAILLGTTVAAQFLLGRLKTPKVVNND